MDPQTGGKKVPWWGNCSSPENSQTTGTGRHFPSLHQKGRQLFCQAATVPSLCGLHGKAIGTSGLLHPWSQSRPEAASSRPQDQRSGWHQASRMPELLWPSPALVTYLLGDRGPVLPPGWPSTGLSLMGGSPRTQSSVFAVSLASSLLSPPPEEGSALLALFSLPRQCPPLTIPPAAYPHADDSPVFISGMGNFIG